MSNIHVEIVSRQLDKLSLAFWGEVYAKVKSISHRVQMVFDCLRLDECAKGVDVDGETTTRAPQCKRLSRN